MPRLLLLPILGLLLTLAALGWRSQRAGPEEAIFESKALPPQAGPLCAWRGPEADLRRFFPGATRYETQTLILSGLRGELTERLGRSPTADENALRSYPVFQDQELVGTVLTRRVKGTFGAIELVLAVDPQQKVCGLRLQRLREPEAAARALQDPAWLGSLTGKRADSPWNNRTEISLLPPEAQASGEAVVEGTRSLLVLLAAASQGHALPAHRHH